MPATQTKKYRCAVVSVVPFHPGTRAMPVEPWDDSSVHARELLEAKKALREHGIEATLLEPAGDPARTIERIAREGEYDTIVIGSRSRRFGGQSVLFAADDREIHPLIPCQPISSTQLASAAWTPPSPALTTVGLAGIHLLVHFNSEGASLTKDA